MARLTRLLMIIISVWACCSISSISAGYTVEEKLEQLDKNYIEMQKVFAEKLKLLERQNLRNQETLMAQITQLEAKVTRMAELESKIQQQDSLLFALQQRDTIVKSSNQVNDDRSYYAGISNSSARAAPLSAMPHSCGDLKNLGHTLKGVYLVVGVKLIETIYCDFSKPITDPNFQTLIGYADVKSKPTYFYVQRDYLLYPSLNQFTQTQIPLLKTTTPFTG